MGVGEQFEMRKIPGTKLTHVRCTMCGTNVGAAAEQRMLKVLTDTHQCRKPSLGTATELVQDDWVQRALR
jgi:hypothetical protein